MTGFGGKGVKKYGITGFIRFSGMPCRLNRRRLSCRIDWKTVLDPVRNPLLDPLFLSGFSRVSGIRKRDHGGPVFIAGAVYFVTVASSVFG